MVLVKLSAQCLGTVVLGILQIHNVFTVVSMRLLSLAYECLSWPHSWKTRGKSLKCSSGCWPGENQWDEVCEVLFNSKVCTSLSLAGPWVEGFGVCLFWEADYGVGLLALEACAKLFVKGMANVTPVRSHVSPSLPPKTRACSLINSKVIPASHLENTRLFHWSRPGA